VWRFEVLLQITVHLDVLFQFALCVLFFFVQFLNSEVQSSNLVLFALFALVECLPLRYLQFLQSLVEVRRAVCHFLRMFFLLLGKSEFQSADALSEGVNFSFEDVLGVTVIVALFRDLLFNVLKLDLHFLELPIEHSDFALRSRFVFFELLFQLSAFVVRVGEFLFRPFQLEK
jgi:hypothetical protein